VAPVADSGLVAAARLLLRWAQERLGGSGEADAGGRKDMREREKGAGARDG